MRVQSVTEPAIDAAEVLVRTQACIACRKPSIIVMSAEEHQAYKDWRGGKIDYVQQAFPRTSPEMRELVKTGIHPECWDEMFGEEEEI